MYKYPFLNLRSRNDFSKRVSSKIPLVKIKRLVKDVATNKDKYWYDYLGKCEPKNGKYVRGARENSPLAIVLTLIDGLLASYDNLLPDYIYGGVKGKSNSLATCSLLASTKRSMIKIDFSTFFEQITEKRVFQFFYHKCGCKMGFSKFASEICCVSKGPKNNPESDRVLARGFSPSMRLAIWCNLEFFMRLKTLVQKRLGKCYPRIVIWVDDIAIVADAPKEKMNQLFEEMLELAGKYGLKINEEKSCVLGYEEPKEFLGLCLYKKSLGLKESKQERLKMLKKIARILPEKRDRKYFDAKYKSLMNYKRQYTKLCFKK